MKDFREEYEKIFYNKILGEAPITPAAAPSTPPVATKPAGPVPLTPQIIQSKANSIIAAATSAISAATTSTEAHQILGIANDAISLKIRALICPNAVRLVVKRRSITLSQR